MKGGILPLLNKRGILYNAKQMTEALRPPSEQSSLPNFERTIRFAPDGSYDVDSTPLASREFPFSFSERELSEAAGEIESVHNILSDVELLEADDNWKNEAKASLLWIIHSATFQALGEKKQLGLITTPENVFRDGMVSFINAGAEKLNLHSPVRSSGNKPEYIGGTRRQHGLTTGEFGARAGIKMGLSKEEWFGNVVAHILHDSGQSALSHVGEQTLEIALELPEVIERLAETTGHGPISSSHEERSVEIALSPEMARNLLAVGVDPQTVADNIRNEHYGLGIFDTLAYLYRDNQNIVAKVGGLDPFPKELIDEIFNSIHGVNRDTQLVQFAEAGVDALKKLLALRIDASRKVYTNPETLKIEAMMIDVMVRMIKDGAINVLDFINGTDENIRVHARSIAERNTEYNDLATALSGSVLPNMRVVDPQQLDSQFVGMDLYALKEEVRRNISSMRGVNLSNNSFYIVPPYDPTGKKVAVEVNGERVVVATDKGMDFRVHAHQGQMIILFRDDVPLSTQEQIEAMLTKGTRSDETLYQYVIDEPGLVPIFNEFQEALKHQYKTEVEDATEERRVVWRSGGLSFIHVSKRTSNNGEEEYFVEAKFARSPIGSDNRVDRDCIKKVIDADQYRRYIEESGSALDLLLSDEEITDQNRQQIQSILEQLNVERANGVSEVTNERVIKFKSTDNGEVGQIIISTAKEGVIQKNTTISLPRYRESTLTLVNGKAATTMDMMGIKQVLDQTTGLIPQSQ